MAIVGAGSLASALAVSLKSAGYAIDEILSRPAPASLRNGRKLAREVGASAATLNSTRGNSPVTWFCVSDREIASAAKALAAATRWTSRIALHSSGALSSGELNALRKCGASVASVHPLMSFVRGSRTSMQGVPFAIEGDGEAVRAARKIVADLGGKPFRVGKKNKDAYHAWGMFSSPFLIALLAAAERVASAAGIRPGDARKKMLPILRQTLANYERLGASASFSGPIARGDVETVRKHLKVLKGISGSRQVYLALAREAIKSLPSQNKSELRRVLAVRRR